MASWGTMSHCFLVLVVLLALQDAAGKRYHLHLCFWFKLNVICNLKLKCFHLSKKRKEFEEGSDRTSAPDFLNVISYGNILLLKNDYKNNG